MSDLQNFTMPDKAPDPPQERKGALPSIAFDQGLPASVEAEKTVLGAILIDNAYFNEAAEKIESDDFSLDSNRRIFLRMSELVDANQAVDIVTLAAELDRYKERDAIGGVAYLASLTESLPRRPVIGEYIRIIKDKAQLRRMMMIFSAGIARAADQSESALAILESAEGELLQIAQDAQSGALRTIYQSVEAAGGTEPYLRQYTDPEIRPGLQTGFLDYDAMTGGLQKSELTIIAARPSMGKALRIDCMIKTVDGWKCNRDLRIGDKLASVDGRPSVVDGVFPQGLRQMYSVQFSDGRELEVDGEHLWLAYYRSWNTPRVLTTLKLIEMLGRKRYQHRLWIDTPTGQFGKDIDLPLDAWVLGALLGNGCMADGHGSITFSSRDPQTIANLANRMPKGCELKQQSKYDWRINGTDDEHAPILKGILSRLGLLGSRAENKHIPQAYLMACRPTRVRLLQGLMDTDGNVEKTGSLVYSTSSYKLAWDVQELARSLGAVVSISIRENPKYRYKGEVRTGQRAYRLYISHPKASEFVSLPRKRDRIKTGFSRICRLTFESIKPTAIELAQCISVTHPSHLYIASYGYVVTHNTALALNIAQNIAIGTKKTVAIFSLEMSRPSLERRMMASRAWVNVQKAMEGIYLNREERTRLENALGDLVESNIFIDDSASLTPIQLRAKARRLKQRQGGLDLIIVDYMQLMSAGVKTGSRQEEVAHISRSLKACAKELEVSVIALAQLHRGPEQRTDKRPILSDLRESGQIEQDADVCAFVHRPCYYEPDNPDLAGLAEIVLAKQRSGPTGVVKLVFVAQHTRFDNLARG